MKVRAIQCSACQDIIYSRHASDERICGCGWTSIGGGIHSPIADGFGSFSFLDIEVDATEGDLKIDYLMLTGNFGRISCGIQLEKID